MSLNLQLIMQHICMVAGESSPKVGAGGFPLLVPCTAIKLKSIDSLYVPQELSHLIRNNLRTSCRLLRC